MQGVAPCFRYFGAFSRRAAPAEKGAERAGRGFAVVADEVRKPAEKTMLATREVGEVITGFPPPADFPPEAFRILPLPAGAGRYKSWKNAAAAAGSTV